MKAPRIPSFNHMEEDNEGMKPKMFRNSFKRYTSIPIFFTFLNWKLFFKAKHWFVRRQPRPLNETFIDMVDDVFRNRWRTLLSVDDMVKAQKILFEFFF